MVMNMIVKDVFTSINTEIRYRLMYLFVQCLQMVQKTDARAVASFDCYLKNGCASNITFRML